MLFAAGCYVLLLGFAYGLLSFMERAAAMRGSHRKPLPWYVDKALRCFFLFCFSLPLLYVFPIIGSVLTLYYATWYLDGAEKLSHSLQLRSEKHAPYLRNIFIWHWLAKRWNLQLKRTAELPKGKQYIFAFHPHGVLPFGGMINMCTDLTGRFSKVLPGIDVRSLAASFCFYVPFYRDLMLSGGVIDAARYNAQAALRGNYSLLLYPGGATEALYAGPGMNVVVLKKRRGFIKLALETGASLVPCYTFGENDGFSVVTQMPSWLDGARKKWQAIFGFSLPCITSIIPRKCNMTTVLGRPIEVERVEQPTTEQIDQLLAVFIQKLEELYQENAEKYGAKGTLTVL